MAKEIKNTQTTKKQNKTEIHRILVKIPNYRNIHRKTTICLIVRLELVQKQQYNMIILAILVFLNTVVI